MLAPAGVLILLLSFDTSHGAILASRSRQYEQMRAAIVGAESSYGLGGKVFLNADEQRADHVLKELKKSELRDAESGQPVAGRHFFDARPMIEKSAVFKTLQLMPKGAVLHLHNSAAVSSLWVIKNLTYRHEAKLCQVEGNFFFTVRPLAHCLDNQTQQITEMRKERTQDIPAFDSWLESIINMKHKPTAKKACTASIDELWVDFESCFSAMKGFLQYKPFFEAYHRQLLHEFHADGVYYLEMRVALPKLFDEDGREYGPAQVAALLQQIVAEFRGLNPTFHGVKIILAKHKHMDDVELQNSLKLYDSLSTAFPGFVIGFDLVGQEDNNRSLKSFVPSLLLPAVEARMPNYYLHAGETVGHYTEADENVIDAVLLNSRRIGHGFALFKHPLLWYAIRQKQMAIEVCPISNQVLGLVRDLRNHPASFYVAQNIPITIASDDPGFWDAAGVSYDYYYAFMAIAPETGLGFLKQLVWDSLRYSTINTEERQNITSTMEKQWASFINQLGKVNITEP